MEMDKSSCYSWAKGQTGFDPMQATERYDEDNDEDADFAETEQY